MISKKHNQDGGALGDEINLLESGFLAVHSKDERGRTVLCIDRIKATPPFATRDAAVSTFVVMMKTDTEGSYFLVVQTYVRLVYILAHSS